MRGLLRRPGRPRWIDDRLWNKRQLPVFTGELNFSKDSKPILSRIAVTLIFIRVNQLIRFVKPDPKVIEDVLGQTDIHNFFNLEYAVQVTLNLAGIDQRQECIVTESSLNNLHTRGYNTLFYVKYMKSFLDPGILRFKDRRIDDTFIAVFRENPSNEARGVNPVDSHKAGVMGIKHLCKIKKTRLAEIRRNPFNPSFSH